MGQNDDQAHARKHEAEALVGRSVGTANLSLDSLKNEGVLIEVSVHGLALCSRASTNAELGRTDDDLRRKRLTPGVTKTIPVEELSSLEAVQVQVYRNLADSGYDDVGFGQARYVPYAAWPEWYERQQDCESRWEDILDRLCARMPDFAADSEGVFRLMAVKSWQAIWSNHAEADDVTVDKVVYLRSQYQEFEDRVVQYALGKIPSEDAIRSRLVLHWTPRIIMTGADYAAEVARLATEQAQAAQARADEQQAWQDELTAMHEGAQVRQIIADKLRQTMMSLPDPREGMVLHLRQRLAGIAESTRQSIEDKGRLYKPTADSLRKIDSTFQRMDMGDDDLRALIDELRVRVDAKTEEGKYNVVAIGETLRKIERLKGSTIATRSAAKRAGGRIDAIGK